MCGELKDSKIAHSQDIHNVGFQELLLNKHNKLWLGDGIQVVLHAFAFLCEPPLCTLQVFGRVIIVYEPGAFHHVELASGFEKFVFKVSFVDCF